MKIAPMLRCNALFSLIFIFLLASSSWAQEAASCGPLTNHYGPFDYRKATKVTIDTVERVHFTQRVESLQGGQTSITAGGDLDYTLHVFPNHHRALMAVMRLAEKEKKVIPRGMDYSVPCWFERAERFAPDDAMVKVLFGVYLAKNDQPRNAEQQLREARELASESDMPEDNANLYYNMGLAYVDLKDYDRALESAHKAYALGFPLPGLYNMLKRLGKWRDDPANSGVKPIRTPAEGTPR